MTAVITRVIYVIIPDKVGLIENYESVVFPFLLDIIFRVTSITIRINSFRH